MSQPWDNGDLWCRRYQPAGRASARLVCLPHAGGSASFFRPLALALGPDVDLVAIQYPGRQDRRREQPIDEMGVLADRVFRILLSQPELPLTLFGHSMGAVLGFELVRRFEADGRRPVHLFASGRRSPTSVRDEKVHLLDDAGILAEVRALNGTASTVLDNDEMMRAALPSLRADYKAIETYRTADETTVSCPITVLVGDDDPKTTLDEARAWVRHTSGQFDLRVFPGGHFFLVNQSDAVTRMLSEHLTGACSRSAAHP
jgi:surfactin synthase thioesterase subunit